jgi:Reeler domain
MSSRFIVLVGLFLALVYSFATTTSISAYPTGPDPARTGGFGEATCNSLGCHRTYKLDEGKAAGLGDLVISGLPEKYEPGKTYPVKVTVTHLQDQGHWGFQLAARVKASGVQAGELKPTDERTQIVEDKGIQYIEHTMDGIFSNVFDFSWVAPASSVGDVIMHAAGNAADGDLTPEGDYIYTTSATIPSAAP